jgi:hypothetical protein
VDEAHWGKNLPFATRLDRVKGLPNPAECQRATDLFLKTQWLLERGGCGAAKPDAAVDWLVLTTVRAVVRPRQDLVFENLLLRQQLGVLTRPTRRRSRTRLRLWDKLLWILVHRFCAGWREHLSLVTPETVVRWHRQGWRLFWRWKSRSPGGRPHLTPEVRNLIATMSRDNRLWAPSGSRASC